MNLRQILQKKSDAELLELHKATLKIGAADDDELCAEVEQAFNRADSIEYLLDIAANHDHESEEE